jgi:hypothetical protein
MVCGSYSLLDNSIVALGFRNMLLRIGIVHLDFKIICKWVHERAELIVTSSISNPESSQVVNSKDLTQAIAVNALCLFLNILSRAILKNIL